MKTIYLFSILLLFTSCYSYNKIELSVNSINSEKTYKVITINGNKIKDKNCKLTSTSLNCSKSKIPINEIVELKERKFSYLKTTVIPLVYVGAGIGMLAIALGN